MSSSGATSAEHRVMMIWCPDFSVTAALVEQELPLSLPAAVMHGHAIGVCNAAARSDGVRRGMRRRDAQSRSPRLRLMDENTARDARLFDDVVRAVEERRPGVMPLRPGLLAVRAPGRWSARRATNQGGRAAGERDAAAEISQVVVDSGVWDVRVGVADDLFTAEHAARSARTQEQRIIEPGESPAFLRDLPVEVLGTESADDGGCGTGGGAGPAAAAQIAEMISLLRRLGVFRLGDLAALPRAEVSGRFGPMGDRIWQQISGGDLRGIAGRTPPPELHREVEFDPPLDSVEAICFSTRTTAEEFIGVLASHQLVTTQVLIEAMVESTVGSGSERAVVSRRSWLHPRHFTPRDLIDRVHWQLHGQNNGSVRSRRGSSLVGSFTDPICGLRLVPETVEPAGEHAATLWGNGAEELVHRGMAKVQAMLGYDAVLVPMLQGGRTPRSRQGWVPWGEPVSRARPVDRPWPGQIGGPAPVRVFDEPVRSEMRSEDGSEVRISARCESSGDPASMLLPDGQWSRVRAWAGPWPLDEAWWESSGSVDQAGSPSARRPPTFRMQVVDEGGRAWLLRYLRRWWIEAAYD